MSQAPMFPAAIVGCGRIAGRGDEPSVSGPVRTHAQAYFRHRAFQLEAICDPDQGALRTFGERWRAARSYSSFERFVDAERPAVVSICSRTSEHYGQLRQLLDHGSAPVVLVEKPICQRRPELADVLARAASSRAIVIVNHTRRFDPCHQHVAHAIAAGRFGAVVGGRCEYYGGWLNNGTHAVDTLRMWLGDVTVESARRSPVPLTRPGDPCLDVRLRTGQGATIDITACDESHFQLFEIDLRFDRGRVVATDFGRRIRMEEVSVNALGERELAPTADSPLTALSDPCFHPIAHIAGVLAARQPPSTVGASLIDAAATMSVMWDAVEAA